MAAGRDFAQALGAVVKRRRLRLRMSQEALAEAANIHRTYVTHIETGQKVVTVTVARRLAIGLGLTFPRLVTEAERELTKPSDGPDDRKRPSSHSPRR